MFRGQINAPPRSSVFGMVILLGLIVLFGLLQTRPLPDSLQAWVPRAIFMLAPLSIAARSIYTIHFNVLLLCYYLARLFPEFSIYPFSGLTFLMLYAYIVILVPPLRKTVGWARSGKFDQTVWVLVLITVIVPALALMAWVHFLSPNLHRYTGMVPQLPLWLIVFYAIGNAAFNAAMEETIWRGVMLEALDSAFGPGLWPVIIQAISFAGAHYRNGFPNGIVGSAMVAVFGLMLAAIRRKSKGILGCWLAHAAVDATIFCLILHYARESN